MPTVLCAMRQGPRPPLPAAVLRPMVLRRRTRRTFGVKWTRDAAHPIGDLPQTLDRLRKCRMALGCSCSS